METIELNGVTFDLSKALPLLVGDWRALAKLGIILGESENQGVGVERLAITAQYILKKANPDIADDFVNSLRLADIMRIAEQAPRAEEVSLDRPT